MDYAEPGSDTATTAATMIGNATTMDEMENFSRPTMDNCSDAAPINEKRGRRPATKQRWIMWSRKDAATISDASGRTRTKGGKGESLSTR